MVEGPGVRRWSLHDGPERARPDWCGQHRESDEGASRGSRKGKVAAFFWEMRAPIASLHFSALNQGSPPLKIEQSIGGLFAHDDLLDRLKVLDDVCKGLDRCRVGT
jgi:hypothetical protein